MWLSGVQSIMEACRQEAAITAERTRLSRQVMIHVGVPASAQSSAMSFRHARLVASQPSDLILLLRLYGPIPVDDV